MNAGLILGAVALAGLAMAAMQGKGVEAGETGYFPPDETGYFPPDSPQPPPEIITEEPPPGPLGGQHRLVPVGDLSIKVLNFLL